MKRITLFKLVVGILFIAISLIGCIPFALNIADVQTEFTSSSSGGLDLGLGGNDSSTRRNIPILATNYPILLGFFALSGAVLIASIRQKKN